MGWTEVLTTAEMRALETAAMAGGAVTGLDLMERAGAAVAGAIRLRWPRAGRVTVLCGPGNNGGDGYVVARHLAQAGWQVRVLGMDNAPGPDAAVMKRRWAALGGIDILIHNAGVAEFAPIADASAEVYEKQFSVNVDGVFHGTSAAVPHLRDGGRIIIIGSINAHWLSFPGGSIYAATKAAINNLTLNLAAQLGQDGIRVNAVAPGPIWTPLQPATQEPEKIRSFGADTPLGRAGQPAEVAPAFVFLAAPAEASYVSGTVLGVTGGKPVF